MLIILLMEHMINQFNDECIYTAPDPNKLYRMNNQPVNANKGWTKLMKWTMLTKKHPILEKKIKNYLKKHPEEINKQNDIGWTALMMACYASNICSTENTVKILIDAGANLDLQKKNGWTALMLASSNSKIDSTEKTVEMLIKNGANLYLKDINGSTAFDNACKNIGTFSSKNTAKLLLLAEINQETY